MYSIPIMKSNNAVDAFINRIEASDELARLVRVIFIPSYVAMAKPKRISVPLPGLVHVDRSILVLPGVPLACESGVRHSLQSMVQDVGQDAIVIDPRMWMQFVQLKSMSLYGKCPVLSNITIPADALPRLESLELWDCDPSMLGMFAQMKYVVFFAAGSYTDGLPLPKPTLIATFSIPGYIGFGRDGMP